MHWIGTSAWIQCFVEENARPAWRWRLSPGPPAHRLRKTLGGAMAFELTDGEIAEQNEKELEWLEADYGYLA